MLPDASNDPCCYKGSAILRLSIVLPKVYPSMNRSFLFCPSIIFFIPASLSSTSVGHTFTKLSRVVYASASVVVGSLCLISGSASIITPPLIHDVHTLAKFFTYKFRFHISSFMGP